MQDMSGTVDYQVMGFGSSWTGGACSTRPASMAGGSAIEPLSSSRAAERPLRRRRSMKSVAVLLVLTLSALGSAYAEDALTPQAMEELFTQALASRTASKEKLVEYRKKIGALEENNMESAKMLAGSAKALEVRQLSIGLIARFLPKRSSVDALLSLLKSDDKDVTKLAAAHLLSIEDKEVQKRLDEFYAVLGEPRPPCVQLLQKIQE
jgi:hypothetical protein